VQTIPRASICVCQKFSIFTRSSDERLVRKRGEKDSGSVFSEAAVVAPASSAQTCVEKLAQLFPSASAMRIPVRVMTLSTARRPLQEQTVIEFGTEQEVLFSSTLPLEFEDGVRVLNSDGSLDARATVVAVRYHQGRKAVAARFIGKVGNWIIKR
jgi:hypothetical protein